MKVLELQNYPFDRVEIEWHGPFPWDESMTAFNADTEVMTLPGIYRAESAGHNRQLIKYIGSVSNSFAQRLNGRHTIKQKLVNGSFRKIRMYLGVLKPERGITISRRNLVEIEYILQNAHWHDLYSWHGISYLPKRSRGEGWNIVNMGKRGDLHRVIAYPALAVSGHDR
jgi:hypothetical protein